MKRRSLFSLLLVLLLVVLAACNDSSDDNTTNDDVKNDAGENTDSTTGESNPSGNLVIYTGRDEGLVQGVIEKFNERYPDINVEYMTMGAQQILERTRGEKANP